MKAALLAFAALAAMVPGIAHAQNTLRVDTNLTANQQIRSQNGRFHLIMQSDCNLVLYEGGRALWASNTHNRGFGCFVRMQGDGNLVVYDSNETPLWASNTVGRSNPTLQVEDSGDLVMYSGGRAVWRTNTAQRAPEPDRPGRPGGGSGGGSGGGGGGYDRDRPWQGADVLRSGDELRNDREDSISSARGDYRLTLRRSCELEVADSRGWNARVRWSAGTAYAGRNCRLVLRNNGELILIADGRTIWGTGSSGRDAIAYVDRDGYLVVYDRDRNREIFSSRRDRGRRY